MTQQSNQAADKPTHRIFTVTGNGKSARWTPIGAAWPNSDGEGFSISLEALPNGGRTVMRAIKERVEEAEGR